MNKTTVQSPFPEEYPGYLLVPEALTFPQLLQFESALVATRGKADALSCVVSIQAINAIVEWKIENLPALPEPKDIFENHPYETAGKFYRFVLGEVARVFRSERYVPKV